MKEGGKEMTKEMVEKNLELQYHLMMQLLQEPDSIEIADGAETILLPEDDAELREANLKLGRRRERQGKRTAYRRPEPQAIRGQLDILRDGRIIGSPEGAISPGRGA